MSATIATMGIIYHAGHCCGSWAFQPGSTIDCFFPLTTCITTSTNIRGSLKGGGSYVTFCTIPPSSMSRVCSIFSDRVLPLSPGKKPRVRTMACIILGVSWTSPINNSLGSFPCLVLSVLLDCGFLRGTLLS